MVSLRSEKFLDDENEPFSDERAWRDQARAGIDENGEWLVPGQLLPNGEPWEPDGNY